MTKKLKILGPYTPDHEGPFCTRDGRPVDLRIRDGRECYPIAGYVGNDETISEWTASGHYSNNMNTAIDLMNAEEVPEAREFWIVKYSDGSLSVFKHFDTANGYAAERKNTRILHVREVLPGDEA